MNHLKECERWSTSPTITKPPPSPPLNGENRAPGHYAGNAAVPATGRTATATRYLLAGIRLALGAADRPDVDGGPAAGHQPVHGRPPRLRRRSCPARLAGRRKHVGPRPPMGGDTIRATQHLAHVEPHGVRAIRLPGSRTRHGPATISLPHRSGDGQIPRARPFERASHVRSSP
jgi:hypothetical protein